MFDTYSTLMVGNADQVLISFLCRKPVFLGMSVVNCLGFVFPGLWSPIEVTSSNCSLLLFSNLSICSCGVIFSYLVRQPPFVGLTLEHPWIYQLPSADFPILLVDSAGFAGSSMPPMRPFCVELDKLCRRDWCCLVSFIILGLLKLFQEPIGSQSHIYFLTHIIPKCFSIVLHSLKKWMLWFIGFAWKKTLCVMF